MNPLVAKIAEEIRKCGPISFARFMELALYCPVYGYYEKEADTVGRCGDYYTSVSVGSLFGELLALQFSQWLEQLLSDGPSRGWVGTPPPGPEAAQPACSGSVGSGEKPLRLVEAGAHKGDLARDILFWLRQHRPELLKAVEYVVVEPSSRRQQWQRQTLESLSGKVQWVNRLEELTPTRGIIFSNELLDAFPSHRWAWDVSRKAWVESGVSFDNGRFSWVRLEPVKTRTAPPVDWPEDVRANLPDGFTIEVAPAAEQWWARAARLLGRGKLLTIDYGLTAEERMAPERFGGTLRGYRRHDAVVDVLSNPGEQDLTAHVDFDGLLEVGESAGLTTDGLFTQEQFLTRIAAPVLRKEVAFGPWTAQRTRQFQTLTHPGHLGRAFRVLVQSR